MKPGGYFEIQESAIWAWSDDDTLKDDSPYMNFLRSLNDAAQASGKPLNIAHELKSWITDAGFQGVHESIYALPFGAWVGLFRTLSSLNR